MILYKYQISSWPLTFIQGHSFGLPHMNLNIFFSEITWLFELKFHMEYSLDCFRSLDQNDCSPHIWYVKICFNHKISWAWPIQTYLFIKNTIFTCVALTKAGLEVGPLRQFIRLSVRNTLGCQVCVICNSNSFQFSYFVHIWLIFSYFLGLLSMDILSIWNAKGVSGLCNLWLQQF